MARMTGFEIYVNLGFLRNMISVMTEEDIFRVIDLSRTFAAKQHSEADEKELRHLCDKFKERVQ